MGWFNKAFRGNKNSDKVDLTNITRTETIEGLSTPGIIKNFHYYFTDLEVYSDGLISCWGMVDLAMFRQKLSEEWVVTSIPDGEFFSISGLGRWQIEDAHWLYNPNTLYDHVTSLVKRLNPDMQNLHNYHGSDVRQIGKTRISKHSLPSPTPFYRHENSSYWPQRMDSAKFWVFYRDDDQKVYLTDLSIYKNARVEITKLPKRLVLQFDQLPQWVENGRILTELAKGEQVNILNLGSFRVSQGDGIPIKDKLYELEDKFKELQGGENSIRKCARLFEEYKASPSKGAKKALKQAYEAIPKRNRVYVGDMDNKDYAVRYVLYGKQVKKEWDKDRFTPFPFDDLPLMDDG